MTDRVYPSAKTVTTPNPATAKPHIRHPYRPNPIPHRRRSRRSCFRLCCFWSILIITLLVLMAAIAGCVAYVIYSPRRPQFTVTSLRILHFNLTTSASDGTTRLLSNVNLTLSVKNPNKKIKYTYDVVFLSLYSDKVLIANGSFNSFISYPKVSNVMRSTLMSGSDMIDADLVAGLRSDLKRRKGFPIEAEMDTNVVVTMGKLRTKKVGIRVICEGIKGILPKGKIVSSSSTANVKCKVDLRIKIWKFTI